MSLDAISLSPKAGNSPQHLLIMLHGWGANADDLVPLADMLSLPNYQFLFPNAPFSHPQVPGGLAWYALETGKYEGIAESRQSLKNWLLSLEENTGIPLSRTILSGFSQGGAMSLEIGIQLPLAGICSLSGYLQFQPQPSTAKIPPILIIHGRQDSIVPVTMAHQAREKLTEIGAQVEYHEFNAGHEIPPQVLPILQSFIRAKNQ